MSARFEEKFGVDPLELVRSFAEREARPLSVEFEARAEDPAALYRKLGTLGFTGIPFAEKYGGSGQPYRSYLILVEELARAWAALSNRAYSAARFGGETGAGAEARRPLGRM